jgi:hypothetical protein
MEAWDTWNTSRHARSFVPVTALGHSLATPTAPGHANMKSQVRAAHAGSYFMPLPAPARAALNAKKAHLIVAHGCSMNSHFTLPAATRLVYLVPPACDMDVSSQTALVTTPAALSQLLDFFGGPSSMRARDTTYTIQRYGYGARVLDQVLTFSHDTGYAGVFELPLHRSVVAGKFGAQTAASSAMLLARAREHELTKLDYLQNPSIFLSDYLRFLGPGTYVIAACRGLCGNTATTGAQRTLGSLSPYSREKNAWSSSLVMAGGTLPSISVGLIHHHNAPRDSFRVHGNTTSSDSFRDRAGDTDTDADNNGAAEARRARKARLSHYFGEGVQKRVLQRKLGRAPAPQRQALGELYDYFQRQRG